MLFIKNTEKRQEGLKTVKFGLFFCPYCESEVEVRIKQGYKLKSCGCDSEYDGPNQAILHEKSLKQRWHSMIARCKDKNNHRYGGRGISVCNEWFEYSTFKRWALDNGYKFELTIDRINNDGNYEPSNCRWVTHVENCKNRPQVGRKGTRIQSN